MTCVISGHIVVESDPNQPYVPCRIDGSSDFPEMTIEDVTRVHRKRRVVDRRAVRNNDENFSSLVTMSQTTCCPGDGFTVDILFGQFYSHQVANRPRRAGVLIVCRAIDDVPQITKAAGGGGPARFDPLFARSSALPG